jgi:hypothetical protein
LAVPTNKKAIKREALIHIVAAAAHINLSIPRYLLLVCTKVASYSP